MNNNETIPALTEFELTESAAFDYTSWRMGFVAVVLRLACILGFGILVVSFSTSTPRDRVLFIGLYVVLLGVTFLKTPYWLRAGILLTICFAIGLNALLAWGVWVDATLFFMAFIALAGLLYDQRMDILGFVLCIAAIGAVAVTTSRGIYKLTAEAAPPIAISDWAIYIFDFMVLGAILISAISFFKHEFARVTQHMRITFNALRLERAELEESVLIRTQELEKRTSRMRASTAIARATSELQELTELMDSAAALTADRFELSHVGIFLLDDRRRSAFLQAASSPTGKDLIARGYRVDLDRHNPLATVVEQGGPNLQSGSDASASILDIDFPRTQSRLLLPLRVRGVVEGVMDLHSEQMQAFDQEDAETLQSLADLIAASIENVRLLGDTRALVAQLETLTSYQSQEAWQKYTSRRIPSYQYTPAGVRALLSRPAGPDSGKLMIPVMLRGQTLGIISIRRKDGASELNERERSLVEKIAEQVALAIDNSRLVEEAQKNAQRDQLIASLSSRVRETLDVDSVVRTAALELRRIFDLREAEVTVGTLTPETNLPIQPPGRSTGRTRSH